jgi:hypothetical protein
VPTELRQVQCILKPGDRFSEHSHIEVIGGVLPTGLLMPTIPVRWALTEDQAIREIEAGRIAFYTMVNNVRASVVIAVNRFTFRKYLTTHPDNYRQNNLLYLPDCPR